MKPERVQKEGVWVEDYWKIALKVLSDVKFLDSLLNFDKDNIPEEVIAKIRKDYLTNPDFDPDKMKKVSMACEGLCRWVIAMSEYDEIAKIVAPKKRALAEAEQTYQAAIDKLELKREQLRQVEVCIISRATARRTVSSARNPVSKVEIDRSYSTNARNYFDVME